MIGADEILQNPQKRINKKTLVVLGGLFFLLLLILLYGVITLVTRKSTRSNIRENFSEQPSNSHNPFSSLSLAEQEGKQLSNGNCQGTEKRKLGTLPMRMEDFVFILPYGLMVGDHVTPIDHQYFAPIVFNSPRDAYEVRAMAEATIVDIQPRVKPEYTEYRFVFSISCTLFYYYDLVTSLAPDVQEAYEAAQNGPFKKSINFPVKEGQLVGRIGGQTLDFAVWDMDSNLTGFVVPEHYSERWKIHTVDPLNYYTDDLKNKILSKYIRTADPISGKIDYDIDGRAVGNWFRENTGGYSGGSRTGLDYHKGHLSLSYNYLDPEGVIFSIGEYPGTVSWTMGNRKGSNLPMQFGVKSNGPDPKDIDVSFGLVKYELVQQDLVDPTTGMMWQNKNIIKGLKIKNNDRVEGVALIQMIDSRKLKVEVFHGKTASQVSGFDSDAVMYER